MKKIVHLTSAHPSFDIRIFHKECRTLVREKYNVVLVAQHEKDEKKNGVQIRAISKPKNRFDRMIVSVWRILTKALKEKADLYHFHDPELIPVGIFLKICGKKVVYDVHEDLPRQVLEKLWIHPLLRTAIARCSALAEKISAVCLDGICAATPSIAKKFPARKTALVQNYPIVNELIDQDSFEYLNRRNRICYTGVISELRGAREMVQSMSLLPDHVHAQLILAGKYESAELENSLQQTSGHEQVQFRNWLSREQVTVLMAESKLGVVLFHPSPNHMESQPNKLFEYMSAGIPVVASNFPLWCEMIEKENCGLLVNPLKPEEIAGAIRWLLENPQEAKIMGERGRRAIIEKYNWKSESRKLTNLYRAILERDEKHITI